MKARIYKLLLTCAITIFAGGLFYLGTGLSGIGQLLLLAPIPVLLFSYTATSRAAFSASFVAYLLGGLSMARYLLSLSPPPILVVALVTPSVAFALSILAARFAVGRLRSSIAALVFPAAWTSYEYLISLVSPHGTAGSIAYSLPGFHSLNQIASVTGIWGITFFVMLVPSALATGWHFRRSVKKMLNSVLLPAAIVAVMLTYGTFRLAGNYGDRSFVVGLAATDTSVRHFKSTTLAETYPVVQAYQRRAAELAAQGAALVVLPEKFVGLVPATDSTVYSLFQGTSNAYRVTIVAGFNQLQSPENRNEAVVFSPGTNLLRYEKRYFIPGLESSYLRGDSILVFPFHGASVGVEICKDMDFPGWSRQYGRRGARVLLVPAWDFVVDAILHSDMAIMRGIEEGFSIVRCAQEGLLTISDWKGNVLSSKESFNSDEVLILDTVPIGPGKTIYSEAGDWFAWLNLLLLFLSTTPRIRRLLYVRHKPQIRDSLKPF